MDNIPEQWKPRKNKKNKQAPLVPEWLSSRWLTIKRWIASMLFFFNLLFMFISSLQIPWIGFLFLLNLWILKDYIWKTRKRPEMVVR